jgi:hypothetical protein
MEYKNGWKHLDENLLARLTEARRTELNRFQVRYACECVFYSVHRIVLLRCFNVSHQDICVRGRESDLDVELKGSPTFNGDSVGLVWRAQGRAGSSAEYTNQGRLD